jgi:hypothetical protein
MSYEVTLLYKENLFELISHDRPLCQTSLKNGGGEWIRTTVPFWGADLQSAAINHSATPPYLNTLKQRT